jgi:hypothetical protein
MPKSATLSAQALSDAWPDDDFGGLLRLQYDAGGQLADAHLGNQQLMFGDSGKGNA